MANVVRDSGGGRPVTTVSSRRRVTTRTPQQTQARVDSMSRGASQWGASALEDAITKANSPKYAGGWVDDNLWNARNGGLDRIQNPTSPPGGGPSGGGGGGGGRGGGMAAPDPNALFGPYAAKIMELAGQLQPDPDTLTPKINSAVDADVAAARAALGTVQNQTGDPYAELQFQAPQFDPNIARLLASQGMGTGAADAAQMAAQQDLNNNAGLWGNFKTAMSGVQQAANQAWNADRAQNDAQTIAQIEAQRAALLNQADARQQTRDEDMKMKRLELIMQLLSQGFNAGADVSGLNLGGL